MVPPAAITSDIAVASPMFEVAQTPISAPHDALFSLHGKTIVITGAGRGLGIVLAGAVLEAGGHVACLDVLPQPAKKEWAELMKIANLSGQHLSYHLCDITNEEQLAETLNNISITGDSLNAPLYGTVACAGVQQQVEAMDYPKADFERILNINVTGTFLTAKHTARILRETGVRGSIVLIASMSGQIANRGLACTAYNSSKAAVQQMCRSTAQEWGQYGIRVNSLSPGYIRTAMTDSLLVAEPEVEKTWMAGALLGRLGVPEDFKAPTVFLLSQGSSFMTGSDLRVDGGHCAAA